MCVWCRNSSKRGGGTPTTQSFNHTHTQLLFSETYSLSFKNIHIHTLFQVHTFSFKHILPLSFKHTHTHTHTHHPVSRTSTHPPPPPLSLSLSLTQWHAKNKCKKQKKRQPTYYKRPAKPVLILLFHAQGHKRHALSRNGYNKTRKWMGEQLPTFHASFNHLHLTCITRTLQPTPL